MTTTAPEIDVIRKLMGAFPDLFYLGEAVTLDLAIQRIKSAMQKGAESSQKATTPTRPEEVQNAIKQFTVENKELGNAHVEELIAYITALESHPLDARSWIAGRDAAAQAALDAQGKNPDGTDKEGYKLHNEGLRTAASVIYGLTPPASPGGWQPIDTAPKSTTIPVDILDEDGVRYTDMVWESSCPTEPSGKWKKRGSAWYDWGYIKATHWMPLPQPPQREENKNV